MSRLFCALALLSLVGCQATYTSIRKNEDGSYMLTRIKQNPFSAWGTLHRCTPSNEGRQLTCAVLAEP